MATTIEKDYEILCGTDRYGNTGTCVETEVGLRSVVSNDVDRRVKPANPIQSMTAMASQSRSINRLPLYRRYCYSQYPLSYRTIADYGYFSQPNYEKPRWEGALRNEISDSVAAQIGETVYEARETVTCVYNAAKSLWGWYKCIKSFGTKCRWFREAKTRRYRPVHNSRNQALADAAGTVIGTDLAIKLGIKPTADLVWDLHERALARNVGLGYLLKVSSNATRSDSGVTLDGWEWDSDLSYRSVVYLKVSSDAPVWTINAPLVLWEIIPVSFMVDWFYDVGSHIKQWMIPDGVTFVSGCQTRKSRVRARKQRFSDTVPPLVKSEWTKSCYFVPLRSGSHTSVTHERVLLGGIPDAVVLPPMPELKEVNHTFRKLFTALEILAMLKRSSVR